MEAGWKQGGSRVGAYVAHGEAGDDNQKHADIISHDQQHDEVATDVRVEQLSVGGGGGRGGAAEQQGGSHHAPGERGREERVMVSEGCGRSNEGQRKGKDDSKQARERESENARKPPGGGDEGVPGMLCNRVQPGRSKKR